jgi:hypothetical protein
MDAENSRLESIILSGIYDQVRCIAMYTYL